MTLAVAEALNPNKPNQTKLTYLPYHTSVMACNFTHEQMVPTSELETLA